MKKNICPICGATLPKIIRKSGNHIGLPFTKCSACNGFYKNNVFIEYAALPKSSKRNFFVNSFVVLITLIIPTIVAAIIYFTAPLPIYAALAAILVPIVFVSAIFARKSFAKIQIAKSNLRCSYKGYLEFLNEYGFKISLKRIAAASDYIEIDSSLDLFGELTGYDKFYKHFPLKLSADYKEFVNAELLNQMQTDAGKTLGKAAITIDSKPALAPQPDSAVIDNNDIDSIEKYIHMILKKYNLKCSDGKFQNIKIDLITYLEVTDDPNKDTLRSIVFNSLKE